MILVDSHFNQIAILGAALMGVAAQCQPLLMRSDEIVAEAVCIVSLA